jgi:phosphatidylglycerol:prolipoprotein diacylglycerol transferase
MALHPTQLYHALSNLLIFGLLWFFRGRKKFDGQLFWVYVLLYAVTRSFLEVFRGDFRGYSFWGVLSASQAVGSVMAVIAVVMLIRLPRSNHASIFNKKNKHKRLY